MIEITNESDFNVPEDIIAKIAEKLNVKDVELLITDSEGIKKLNKEYRSKDRPTDVLSFPYEPTPMAPLGSIVINVDAVKEAANSFGHSPKEEFALLFIHGLLHLLGYDHETDQGQMRQKEQELIEEFQLPQSLIIRNEG